MLVKTGVNGETKDVSIFDVTPENYIVPKGEEHLYHCLVEVVKFDSDTGKRLSKPRVQVFGKKAYEEGVYHNLKKHGYTITVLHDPNEYLTAKKAEEDAKAEEKAAKEAEEARLKAEEEARIEEERKKAEKEALKAEILAELKESGIIQEAKKPGRPKKESSEEAEE
jgi:hypothetical protein